jgi:hypothetical protein
VPFDSVEELAAWGEAVQKSLSTDEDLIAAFVAQPWCGNVQTYDVQATLWRNRYRYRETVDLSSTQALWAQKAQYVRWRLIELRDTSTEKEGARLRHRLALIALSEQRQAWDQLSSGSHWTYRVRYGDDSQTSASWLLSWGQIRDLEIDHSVYRWSFIVRLLGGLAVLATLLILVVRIRRRQRRNTPVR